MTNITTSQRPGRAGVPFTKVAEAADALQAAGQKTTLRAVRDRLGTGSMSTIQQHLATWLAQQPQVQATEYELSANLKRALKAELSVFAENASSALTSRLVDIEADHAALAASAAETETALVEAQERLSAEHQAVAMLTAQVEELRLQLAATQKLAETATTAERDAKATAAAAEARATEASLTAMMAEKRAAAAQERITELTDRLTMRDMEMTAASTEERCTHNASGPMPNSGHDNG